MKACMVCNSNRRADVPGASGTCTRLRQVLAAVGLVAQREDRCLDAVLQAEFGEDAADVGLDGLLADG